MSWTDTHTPLKKNKTMSSKYLQRKCSDQDHGEVHLAHPVLALDSAWDAEVSWERGHCLERHIRPKWQP